MLINFSLFSKKQPQPPKELEESKDEEDINNKTIDVRLIKISMTPVNKFEQHFCCIG